MFIPNTKEITGQAMIDSSGKGQQLPLSPAGLKQMTLWKQAFGGLASLQRCTHCFSVSHKSGECELSPDTHMPSTPGTSTPGCSSPRSQHPICFLWNEDPVLGCPCHVCRFKHTCYLCCRQQHKNKNHKAIHCPYHIQDRPIRPQRPTISR